MPQGNRKSKWPSRFLVIGLAIFVVLLIPWLLRPTALHHDEPAGPVKCASNLRQISQCLLLYSNEHHGSYPPTLATLLLTEPLTSDVLICPGSNDEPATGPTEQAIADEVFQPGHCSYMYLGKCLTNQSADASAVIAFETQDNHAGTGRNVLFGDGHVERMDEPWMKRLETAIREPGPSTRPVVIGVP